MANVVLNRSCNRSCSFCFAPNDASAVMELGELREIAEQLRAQGERTVPLVGGEPTLHPDFTEAVRLVLDLGMNVRLFTNGDFSARVLRCLADIPVERCAVIVNVSASLTSEALVAPHLEPRLAALGPRASLGVTLSDERYPDPDLVELYRRHPLARRFRLGLSQPSLTGTNTSIDYRKPGLGTYVARLALALARENVRVDFDCGLVLCMFSPEELASLERARLDVRSVCGAIPDLAPGGVAWPCYPLSDRYRATRQNTRSSLPLLRRSFDRRLLGFRAAGLYPECPECRFFTSGRCTGGCASRVIRAFSPLGAGA
jgi:hypothetical protein